MSIHVNHHWIATAPLLVNGDMEFIPGLRCNSENYVTGPVDAVALYYARAKADDGLRYLEIPEPQTPIRHNKKLYNFQNDGVSFVLHRWRHVGSALLTDEMGLGKTAQAIVAHENGLDESGSGHHLIICPRSVVHTWKTQLKKWAGVAPKYITSPLTRLDVARPPQFPFTIVSYELLQYLAPALYGTVIIDEAHNFSGRFTKRGSALKSICAMAERRLALTGTEIWSRPRDYWFLFSCLFGASFGSRSEFDLAYCAGKANEFGGLDNQGKSRLKELKYRVGFYRLRRTKAQVGGELPKMTRDVRWIDGTKHAGAMMRSAILSKAPGLYSRALMATLDAKVPAAIDAAADARRFLLFTWTRRHAAWIHRELVSRDVPCFLIDGSVSPTKRSSLIALAAKRKWGIVATGDTLKEGVDGLQHVSSTGIMHSLDFVPNKVRQQEKRLDRIGQKEPVQWIYILMKESMDVWVWEQVKGKLEAWEALTSEDDGLSDALEGKNRRGRSDAELEAEVFKQIYLRAREA